MSDDKQEPLVYRTREATWDIPSAYLTRLDCGKFHLEATPDQIRHVAYNTDGSIKTIEFVTRALTPPNASRRWVRMMLIVEYGGEDNHE